MRESINNDKTPHWSPEDFILHVFTQAGVDSFWHNRILGRLRVVLYGYAYSVTDIGSATIVIGKMQECKSLVLHVTVCLPDAAISVAGILHYEMSQTSHVASLEFSDRCQSVRGSSPKAKAKPKLKRLKGGTK